MLELNHFGCREVGVAPLAAAAAFGLVNCTFERSLLAAIAATAARVARVARVATSLGLCGICCLALSLLLLLGQFLSFTELALSLV